MPSPSLHFLSLVGLLLEVAAKSCQNTFGQVRFVHDMDVPLAVVGMRYKCTNPECPAVLASAESKGLTIAPGDTTLAKK